MEVDRRICTCVNVTNECISNDDDRVVGCRLFALLCCRAVELHCRAVAVGRRAGRQFQISPVASEHPNLKIQLVRRTNELKHSDDNGGRR